MAIQEFQAATSAPAESPAGGSRRRSAPRDDVKKKVLLAMTFLTFLSLRGRQPVAIQASQAEAITVVESSAGGSRRRSAPRDDVMRKALLAMTFLTFPSLRGR